MFWEIVVHVGNCIVDFCLCSCHCFIDDLRGHSSCVLFCVSKIERSAVYVRVGSCSLGVGLDVMEFYDRGQSIIAKEQRYLRKVLTYVIVDTTNKIHPMT